MIESKWYRHIVGIFNIIGEFTNFVCVSPTVKSVSAEEALNKLQQITFGNSLRIIWNKSSVFRAKVFEEYYNFLTDQSQYP